MDGTCRYTQGLDRRKPLCPLRMSASEYYTPTTNKSELTQQDGTAKKTSVTKNLLEISFRQTSLSFKKIFLQRPENVDVRDWSKSIGGGGPEQRGGGS